jgi:hypothetical protein
MMTTTFAVATPHALILTVSHGLLFCQPPSLWRRECRPFSSFHFNEHAIPRSAELQRRLLVRPALPPGAAMRPRHARDYSMTSARLTDETSRSESGDSRLPSNAAFVYPVICLACVAILWSQAPGVQGNAAALNLGADSVAAN